MLANCYPTPCQQNNGSDVLAVGASILEPRLQDEGLDRVIRVDSVIAEEGQHLPFGETLDHRDRLVPEGSLEDAAEATDVILEVLVLQRALRLRHGVVEHRHHQAVLDVGASSARAATRR